MTSRTQNKNTKQKEKTTRYSWSIKSFNIFMICLVVLAGFLYLTQANALAVKGYIIRDLEIKLDDAKVSNRNLELSVQKLQSVGGLAMKSDSIGMVETGEVEYLQLPGGEVAMSK